MFGENSMRLFTEEVKVPEELDEKVSKLVGVPKTYSIAVESLIFDSSLQWVLHKRGPGCRDEIGKLEGIGGSYSNDDEDFPTALKRKLVEKVGADAEIDILKFFEAKLDTLISTTGEKRHWIIASYICLFKSGKLKIGEPEMNSGFIFLPFGSIGLSTLSSSTKSALASLQKEWVEVRALL